VDYYVVNDLLLWRNFLTLFLTSDFSAEKRTRGGGGTAEEAVLLCEMIDCRVRVSWLRILIAV
jgi:hypothetical protein